jgi:amidophosphoribosyltransferase
VGGDRSGFCDACFSGEYLIEFPRRVGRTPLRVVGS